MSTVRVWVLALVLSGIAIGCATKEKPVKSFSSGYDKITVARAEIPGGAENEAIRPDFVTEIKKTSDVVTVIYTYQAKPNQQAALLEKLVSELRRMSGKVPGLVSFNLHKGSGGSRVLNYVQFDSKAAFDAWKASAMFNQHLDAIRPSLQKNESEFFDVVYILQ